MAALPRATSAKPLLTKNGKKPTSRELKLLKEQQAKEVIERGK